MQPSPKNTRCIGQAGVSGVGLSQSPVSMSSLRTAVRSQGCHIVIIYLSVEVCRTRFIREMSRLPKKVISCNDCDLLADTPSRIITKRPASGGKVTRGKGMLATGLVCMPCRVSAEGRSGCRARHGWSPIVGLKRLTIIRAGERRREASSLMKSWAEEKGCC
jgi:hypothetical protein